MCRATEYLLLYQWEFQSGISTGCFNMTAEPQPQEYVITEEDLFCLSDYIEAALHGDESKATIRRLFDTEFGVIRSRPVHQQSEQKCMIGLTYEQCQEVLKRDIEKAKGDEREKVLDEMIATLQNEGMAAGDERGYMRFIQSFSSKQGGEP